MSPPALDITIATDVPVVVTGAMRNPTLAGADGPANLLAAIAVAASTEVRGLGCAVVMSDEIHAARYVRKTHSTSTGAFSSPNTGPIGQVVEGRPRFLAQPPARLVLPSASGAAPTVPLVTISLGDDLTLLRPPRDDIDGLVAAFGVGHVPASVVQLLADHADRMPVVLASRTGAGAVHRASYGFGGSEQDLQQRGLINAGFRDVRSALRSIGTPCGYGRSAYRGTTVRVRSHAFSNRVAVANEMRLTREGILCLSVQGEFCTSSAVRSPRFCCWPSAPLSVPRSPIRSTPPTCRLPR